MFKKITIFYSVLILILMIVMLFLLITISLININKQQNKAVISDAYYNQKLKNKNILKITTDKNIYTTDEKIIITFENMSSYKMIQNDNAPITIKCRPNMGDNYEIAFIEHFDKGNWVAIEPVKRCSEDCNKPCPKNTQIQPKNKEFFIWDQTMQECGERSGNTKILSAPLGKYRISSATWDKKESTFIKIHSNIFQISNISKK